MLLYYALHIQHLRVYIRAGFQRTIFSFVTAAAVAFVSFSIDYYTFKPITEGDYIRNEIMISGNDQKIIYQRLYQILCWNIRAGKMLNLLSQ